MWLNTSKNILYLVTSQLNFFLHRECIWYLNHRLAYSSIYHEIKIKKSNIWSKNILCCYEEFDFSVKMLNICKISTFFNSLHWRVRFYTFLNVIWRKTKSLQGTQLISHRKDKTKIKHMKVCCCNMTVYGKGQIVRILLEGHEKGYISWTQCISSHGWDNFQQEEGLKYSVACLIFLQYLCLPVRLW